LTERRALMVECRLFLIEMHTACTRKRALYPSKRVPQTTTRALNTACTRNANISTLCRTLREEYMALYMALLVVLRALVVVCGTLLEG